MKKIVRVLGGFTAARRRNSHAKGGLGWRIMIPGGTRADAQGNLTTGGTGKSISRVTEKKKDDRGGEVAKEPVGMVNAKGQTSLQDFRSRFSQSKRRSPDQKKKKRGEKQNNLALPVAKKRERRKGKNSALG